VLVWWLWCCVAVVWCVRPPAEARKCSWAAAAAAAMAFDRVLKQTRA
jgi:hypothetical protein